MSELCAVKDCRRPATGSINVTASAASSVPSVMEPRCDAHIVAIYTGTFVSRRAAAPSGEGEDGR